MSKGYINIGLIALGILAAGGGLGACDTKKQQPETLSAASDTTTYGAEPNIALGKRLFNEEQCLTCHSMYGRGGNIGPDLAYVGRRRPVEWISQHIKDPRSRRDGFAKSTPGTVMPRFGFLDEEVKAIAEFLLRQTERAALPDILGFDAPRRRLTAIERGAMLFQRYGCGLCHGVKGSGGVLNVNAYTGGEVTALTYVSRAFNRQSMQEKILQGALSVAKRDTLGPAPPLFMPSYQGVIRDDELDDLITYLFSLAPPRTDE